jgi:Flp pilus assembly protein TadD
LALHRGFLRLAWLLCCSGFVLLALASPSSSTATQLGQGVTIYVRAPNGSPLSQIAEVELIDPLGQSIEHANTIGGRTQFPDVIAGTYTLHVNCAGYERYIESVQVDSSGGGIFVATMRPMPDARKNATAAPGPPILTPKAQKELDQAQESLNNKNWKLAQQHLEAAYQLVPNNPDVDYLFGYYWAKMDDWTKAKSYWEKTLSLAPEHSRALLGLSEATMREGKFADAIPLLKHAIEVAPNSWQPHAMLAEAYLHEKLFTESIAEAEQALKLGQEAAISVEPVLVHALVLHGERQRALENLRIHVQTYPNDARSRKLLENLEQSGTTP